MASTLLTVQEAVSRILASVPRPKETERVCLENALGRVLAQSIFAPRDVPGFWSAAMDGYALAGEDLPQDEPKRFRVAGSSFAGAPFRGSPSRGECVRIMTGALLPKGTDTVIMQEVVTVEPEGSVWIPPGLRRGQNVRPPNEDITQGALVLEAGTELGPPQLGVLASLGIQEVQVFRNVRVCLYSTGDELKEPGEPLEPGELYDSNRPLLVALLQTLGVQPLEVGRLPDHPDELLQKLRTASSQADLILTTGGVSVGEKDWVRTILTTLGRLEFAQIAIKPGRPLAFGWIGESVFFGLPGNPVSSFVSFCVFVRPALEQMRGRRQVGLCPLWARIANAFSRRPGRTEYLRGRLFVDPLGQPTVSLVGPLSSFALSSVASADCLVVIPEEKTHLPEGELVQVLPFNGLFSP
ncbi:molybdopterin molybdotransferase MoeA [Candidatus Methylacidithermus pantelleriae]|uniref:Molybdopterin molybdenumtransferase n=1 Tax=Candidatus Methylacidithermus pantelleriae TaxID=2744239 RepID=A0A8J2BQN6_9BACT|nr:gephyrin-like molybdotransferase Glp [Candidatus Methylacidithermus pantelleriae]CAF0689947.1 Molybdopterin molybdenumtransferase [Candidatus Methylacidithermus pantelleriae]